jgi:hypothetical protein
MRLDRNFSHRYEGRCPHCRDTVYGFLSINWEGPSDVVSCWRCKYHGPRFIEIPDDPPKVKKRRGGPRPRRKQYDEKAPRKRREAW